MSVEFDKQVNFGLTAIAFCEYASVVTVDGDGAVSVSYLE